MIGIDTNVLVRYLAQDDQDQTKIATAFIEDNCMKDNLGIINPDCLIAQINLANYCSSTVTFDVKASNVAGFNLLS